MSMPNLTAFPPDAKETRALENVRRLIEAAPPASHAAIVAALRSDDLDSFWQRVHGSAAWHDMNDAAKAADLTPRKLSGI